jgi:hypothetical protein
MRRALVASWAQLGDLGGARAAAACCGRSWWLWLLRRRTLHVPVRDAFLELPAPCQ